MIPLIPPSPGSFLAVSGLVASVALIDRNLRPSLPNQRCSACAVATSTSSSSFSSLSPLPFASIFLPSSPRTPVVGDLAVASSSEITKAEVGRATWFFLHSVAANFPDKPTKQQQKDAKALVDLLTRIYPCQDCAKHFGKIVKEKPVKVGTGHEFRVWMCEVHNLVNLRIGKSTFNCELVEAKWGRLACEEEDKCRIRGDE